MAKFRTHYDNLNVSRDAPANVIKAAYKALCQKYHPDKYIGGHDEALRIMKSINNAYAVLSDAGKRAEHDRWIDMKEREHASGEAQRIMDIITKNYVAPSVRPEKNRSASWTMLSGIWKNCCARGVKLQLIVTQLSKKLHWGFGLAGIVCVVVTATVLYRPDLKTATVAINQDTEEILKKAKQLVKQGQVAKALPLYLLLAAEGNADAQFQAGLIYATGQGITKDDKQAVDWFGKAAEQGHREAQTKLGFMYATGKGVTQNFSSAIYWCYKAAEQGDATAQYNLGLMYAEGQGVAKDNSLAFTWFSKAAAQDDAQAQYRLGDMYANGMGVAKNNTQAAAFYRSAAKQGLAEAIAVLNKSDRKE